eukprot:TRINITY_DN528_c0_g1_i1.p1 TRINITY_DN528_c0_g1~~TRINITY_DN528_c0_g1_i1.p1  ORF type:complete len:208 (-),score=26.07 TRINITY_DN528_c0_g1_i1:203-826(-)
MESAMAARLLVALFLVVAAVQCADALRHTVEQGVAARDCPVDFRKVDLVSVEAACNNDVADSSLCCTTLYRMVTPYAGVLNAIDSCAGAFLEAFAASSLSNNDQVLRCFEENVGTPVPEDTSARVLQDVPMAEPSEPTGVPGAPAAPGVVGQATPQMGNGRGTQGPVRTAGNAQASVPSSARALGVGFGSVIVAVVICMIAPVFIVA